MVEDWGQLDLHLVVQEQIHSGWQAEEEVEHIGLLQLVMVVLVEELLHLT
jgi:hypothetical protein